MRVAAIRAALDGAAQDGRVLDLWWRDDDAVRHSPALERLLSVSSETGCPLAVAAIPALAEPSLARALRRHSGVTVLVHGWRHANHAPKGEKPAEFGAHRPLSVMIEEIRRARARIFDRFEGAASHVFVPPWNRIAPDVAALLPDVGFAALSGFASRRTGVAGPLDANLDPVNWRGGRTLLPPAALEDAVRAALSPGRTTIGFLTHHLAFDEALWAFCRDFLLCAASHPAIRLRSVADLVVERIPEGRAARHAGRAIAPELVA